MVLLWFIRAGANCREAQKPHRISFWSTEAEMGDRVAVDPSGFSFMVYRGGGE